MVWLGVRMGLGLERGVWEAGLVVVCCSTRVFRSRSMLVACWSVIPGPTGIVWAGPVGGVGWGVGCGVVGAVLLGASLVPTGGACCDLGVFCVRGLLLRVGGLCVVVGGGHDVSIVLVVLGV